MRRMAIVLVLGGALALAPVGDAADDSPGILYAQSVNGASSIWRLGANGADGHELIAAAAQPAWSPDGARIAFAKTVPASPNNGSDIATADAAGGDVRVLTTSHSAGGPAWSPDGAAIAYSQGGAQPGIWTIANDGTNPRELTSTPAGNVDYWPSWSPDGRTIAFTRATLAPGYAPPEIWTIDVASGAVRQLTPSGSDSAAPAWSPDGTRIAFLSGRDHNGRTYGEDETAPNADVFVMDADGSHVAQVTHTRGPEERVTWTSGGGRLLYATAPASSSFGPYQLVLAKRDGGCPTTLTSGTAWHLDPTARRGGASDTRLLDCTRAASVRPVFVAAAPGLAAARVHGGTPAEAALARRLLAGFGRTTAIRSLTLERPPAGEHAPKGSVWLRLEVDGIGTRNSLAAVRPAWEATLIADAYHDQAARSGLPPLAGLTVRYRGSGQTVARTWQQAHDDVGREPVNQDLSAEAISKALHAAVLPKGVHFVSVRFAGLAGVAVPEVVVRIDAATAAGKLLPIDDSVLGPLQLDQGAYLELRGRCGAVLGAIGSAHLGSRSRLGVAHAARC